MELMRRRINQITSSRDNARKQVPLVAHAIEDAAGGDEIAERDRHRWELDPASKDDFEDQD